MGGEVIARLAASMVLADMQLEHGPVGEAKPAQRADGDE
jgi:hypothetical protein